MVDDSKLNFMKYSNSSKCTLISKIQIIFDKCNYVWLQHVRRIELDLLKNIRYERQNSFKSQRPVPIVCCTNERKILVQMDFVLAFICRFFVHFFRINLLFRSIVCLSFSVCCCCKRLRRSLTFFAILRMSRKPFSFLVLNE